MSDTVDPESIARAIEIVRSGESGCLSSIGGKWSKTLAYRSDQFWLEEVDEGTHFDSVITEQQALEALTAHPDAVHTLLARPAWRHFFRVFVEGDRAQTRAALDATRGLPGGPERHRFVYEAFLDGPEQKPSAATREQLKQVAEGGLATRAFDAADYAKDDALANKKAIEYSLHGRDCILAALDPRATSRLLRTPRQPAGGTRRMPDRTEPQQNSAACRPDPNTARGDQEAVTGP